MLTKKTGLGRNLDSLLSHSGVVKQSTGEQAQPSLRKIPLHRIQRSPYQPRQSMDDDALQELASSIKKQGVIQPIVVREIKRGEFELIAGERRWRASQLAGLTEIPAVINNLSDDDAILVALIENIQRENLNPIEEAIALQRLHDEFILTHEQIAEAVGKSRATVTNLLRLLKLSDGVKAYLQNGDIEMGHARALLSLSEANQLKAAKTIVEQSLSVRDTEKLVQHYLHPEKQAKASEQIDPNIISLQNRISESLCAKVNLQHGQSGKGKLVIHYNTLEELDGLVERMV